MPKKQPQIIILLGRSGCGKGTQAKLLIEEFGFDYLGSGSLLRKRMKSKDFSGKKLTQFVNKGVLAPTWLVFNIWTQELERIKNKKNFKGLIVDGSPRRVFEAELIDQAFDWFEFKNIKVVLVDISHKEAFDRLTKRRYCKMCGQIIPWTNEYKDLKICNLCGGELEERPDDTPVAIRKRMEYYKKEVELVVKYYQKAKKLVKVDGERTIKDVYYDIRKAVL